MEHHLSVQIDERLKTKKSCAGVKEGHQRQTIRCKQEKQGDCLQKKISANTHCKCFKQKKNNKSKNVNHFLNASSLSYSSKNVSALIICSPPPPTPSLSDETL